jgi:hypothetical protein
MGEVARVVVGFACRGHIDGLISKGYVLGSAVCCASVTTTTAPDQAAGISSRVQEGQVILTTPISTHAAVGLPP